MAIVLLKPNYPPYVCIVCGLGSRKDRKWFVDLQLAIDNYFNPVNDGAVYLCNECWDGLVRAVGHQAYTIMKEEEPWEASLEITYNSEGELLSGPVGFTELGNLKEVENGTGLPSEGAGDSDPTVAGDDTTTETITSEHGPNDTDDAEPVQQFREFFGKPV